MKAEISDFKSLKRFKPEVIEIVINQSNSTLHKEHYSSDAKNTSLVLSKNGLCYFNYSVGGKKVFSNFNICVIYNKQCASNF